MINTKHSPRTGGGSGGLGLDGPASIPGTCDLFKSVYQNERAISSSLWEVEGGCTRRVQCAAVFLGQLTTMQQCIRILYNVYRKKQ